MNDRWKDIEAIVDRVLSEDPVRRPTIIAEACAGDAVLRHEVESLLRACEAAGGFLENPALAIGPLVVRGASDDVPVPLPERIAGFRIQRVLGVGGMGVVYVAEQERPHRTVALKVIKPGLATPSILRRFEHEAEVLGRLHHPGIAQVYEAGTAEGPLGPQPFFAMELIDGKPITTFAVEHSLKTRERLELLARVCDAVQHAHQQGVIHRDLKPSNVLVEPSGQPKILDFGVARVSRADGSAATVHTQAGQIIGTLAYMSPEQAAGDSVAVDTRSDVYSLGVVAYQLLSGKLPVEIGDRPLHEGVRAVHEQEPAPLSSVDTAYRGDIDTVIGKSLHKDRDRRYQSAAEFAADLRRVLANEPVLARPPSALYQLSKFAQRHRAWVNAAVVLAAVLVLGVVLLIVKNRELDLSRNRAVEAASRESEHRQRAEAETAKVREALLTIQSMFHSDQEGGGRDLRVIDLLDQFVARFPPDAASDPSLTAFRHHVVGSAYRRLGELEPARVHLETALALRRTIIPQPSRELLETQFECAQLQADSGEALVSPRSFADLLESATSVLRTDDPLLLAIRARLAWAHLICHNVNAARAEAESTLLNGLNLDPTDPILADALGTLGEALVASGQQDAALQELQKHLGGLETVALATPRTLALRCRLAQCLVHVGKCAEAASWLSDVAAMKREDVPEVGIYVTALHLLAKALEGTGRREEATERFQQAFWLSHKVNGEFNLPTVRVSADYDRFLIEDPAVTAEMATRTARNAELVLKGAVLRRSRFHPDILQLRMTLARALSLSGNVADAEQQFSQTYYDTLERFGPNAVETTDALMWYSLFLVDHGKASAIAVTLPRLYEYFERTFGPEYPETLLIKFRLGYSKASLNAAEAEKFMQDAFQGLLKAVGPDHDWTMRVAEGLAEFYEQNGLSAAAAAVRPSGDAARSADWRPALTPADVVSLRISTYSRRAAKRSAAGDEAAAIVDLNAAVALLERDTLLLHVDRDEQLRNVLGKRSYSLGQLARTTEALGDTERALVLAKSVANSWPSSQRRRKLALCFIDAAVYRARLGKATDARDALRTAVEDLHSLASEGLDDEHTWRGILNASAWLGSLCADQAKSVADSDAVRSAWAAEGVECLPQVKAAFARLKELGKASWFDETFVSTAQNAADVCRSVNQELHRQRP